MDQNCQGLQGPPLGGAGSHQQGILEDLEELYLVDLEGLGASERKGRGPPTRKQGYHQETGGPLPVNPDDPLPGRHGDHQGVLMDL